uniref:Uncharacterized protein n=1 Tax=Glossina palpalis gambiensis TaxID=67801 RepID=A0A1B0B8Z6_9MUSC
MDQHIEVCSWNFLIKRTVSVIFTQIRICLSGEQERFRCLKSMIKRYKETSELLRRQIWNITSLSDGNVPFSAWPNRLGTDACITLFENLTVDYLQRNAEYVAYSEENPILRQTLVSLLCFMILGIFTLSAFYSINRLTSVRNEKPNKGDRIEIKHRSPHVVLPTFKLCRNAISEFSANQFWFLFIL